MSETLPEKRSRLRNLLKEAPAAEPVPRVEPRRHRSALEPLSYGQEALWFVSQLEGPNPAYNNAVLVRLTGAVDVPAMTHALQTIVARHDALRTRFVERSGIPSQEVVEAIEVQLDPQWVTEAEKEAIYRGTASRAFDVGADQLFRVALFKEAADRFAIVVSLHHIISDAQSVSIFLRELALVYDAYRAGQEPALDPLPVSYIDYVHWQRSWLSGGVLDRQLAYWRTRLQDLPPLLTLPTDHPRPTVQRSRGGTVTFVLPVSHRDALAALGTSHHASLFVVLLASLAVLLHRYSAQRDFAIGTGVSNRRTPELEGLIGYFVNTLVLRVQVEPDQPFSVVLKAARAIFQEALANQDVSYHRVVQELRPDRTAAYSPLFQVMLTLQNASSARRIEVPSLVMDLPSSGAAKFDVSIAIQDEPDGLAAQIEYRADIFDAQTMQRFADHYVQLLDQIVAAPDRAVGDYVVLTAAERRQVIEDWSGRDRAIAGDDRIEALFAAQARMRPTALALRDGPRAVTYGELQAQASRLARHLRTLGVGDETIVGIWLDRGLEAIVGILAVLEAGGAYLPLDPENPRERTQFVLQDAGATLVLTTEAMRATAPADLAQLVLIDDAFREPVDARGDGDRPASARGARSLAYVMYTSGSTGQPRGVAVEHRSVTRLVRDANWITLDADTVTLQHSPLCFDASTFEMWAALLNGGTVVVREGDAADIERLAATVTRHGVNTLWLSAGVLPLWVSLMESGLAAAPRRYLLAGGDVIQEKHVRAIYARDPDVTVINGYGPTENTTFSACFPVPRASLDGATLPIGKPISGTSAYVLDDRQQPQPIGVVGELYVGGAGLARGYLNQPALTTRQFLPDPFSTDPQDRLYRTGDRVRWLASGDLEFLGRIDHQVKIRGFRVELEEIELRLLQLPGVAIGAVVVRDDATLGKRLVAYVVPSDTALTEIGDREAVARHCSASLRKTLPAYMVPGTVVVCETLPLTPNGKVDRRRLPDPDEHDLQRQTYRAPGNEMERVLCGIWQDVLRLEQVGVDDSFFDLGGHSLLATQLVSLIRDRLRRQLPLTELFRRPTVAGVAAYLDREAQATLPDQVPRIAPDTAQRYEPFPLTGVQQAYLLGRSGAFELGNVSTHAYLEIELADIDLARLEWAWNCLIARHDMLRAVFAADGTQRILPTVPHYTIAYDDLRGRPAADLARHIAAVREANSHQIFTAAEWPLFEIRGTRVSDRIVRLHLSLDALPADAMSSLILVRELDRLYVDPETILPPLTIAFRDYVLGLDELRTTALYAQARDYWETRTPLLPPAPDLPLIRDPAAIVQPRFVRRECVLDASRWTRLQQLARTLGVTPSVLLVGVFSRVLGTWSRSRQFTLTLTLFNRIPMHAQVDELVGDFTSLTLLEIDGRAERSFEAFAGAIQSQLWSDLEHRAFDGIEVLRLLNRRAPGGKPVLMPVVFTSTLGLVGLSAETSTGPISRALSDFSPDGSFGITQTSQVWLDNVVSEIDGQLRITWDAIDDLFPAGVLDAMFAAYRGLLEGLATGATDPHDACVPAAPEPQLAVRRRVNATETILPEGLLHEPFAAQVRRQPDAPAVIQGDLTLTYASLDRCARGIAQALHAREVRRNELVAVVMSKGWEQIAAVFGVLYAGAAYLPIDAALPPERIALLLAQGEVRIVLTQQDRARTLPWPDALQILAIDRDDLDQPGVDDRPVCDTTPADLAYVIFTSGSTGVPKGVMIDHRGAVNTIMDLNHRFAVSASDRVLGLSSLSFDLSVYDIFGLLAAGGALVLPDRSRETDTGHWMDLVARHGVTVWNTVPILAQLFVDELMRAGPAENAAAGLRLVMMSGDWIPLPLPARLRSCAPRALLVSLGGATEASIWSIAQVIDHLEPWWTSIPYGRPLANQRFHILAPDRSPTPDWVAGDLYIAGVGLAQGYWRDEQKTHHSFLLHPSTGERLYRTGDLGRYWPDGTIEFLGREDTQVKVHGHRIELGEIEAALLQHEQVAAAAVLVAGDAQDRRIVAYVVPTASVDEGAGVLKDPVQRAAFTLEQRALRRFPPETETIPLPAIDDPRQSATSFDRWGRWLGVLAQVPVEGHGIPKRQYPSAGSLYPVQVYVSLPADAGPGLTAGCYYYDPASHSLRRLRHQPVVESLVAEATLFVVAAMPAIAPLYGGQSARFCRLEAGHVLGLLAAEAPVQGVDFSPRPVEDTPLLQEAFRLPREHTVLASAVVRLSPASARSAPVSSEVTLLSRAVRRQSYRDFVADGADAARLVELLAAMPDAGVALYVYLKSGRDTSGRHAGFFLFDRSTRQLRQMAPPDEALATSIHDRSNHDVHERAAFSIYLVAGAGPDREIAAGLVGQALMTLAPDYGLGLCPIADIASARLRERLNVADAEPLLYTFEGGAITAAQMIDWPLASLSRASAGGSSREDDWRDFLRARLPAYMVPSVFVPLERLPLTRNGKLDRAALPAVDASSRPMVPFQEPRTDLERGIAAKWVELLRLETVGVYDNFFELGGNSLSATRLLSAIRHQFADDADRLSLELFFGNPTVAALAEHLALSRDARLLAQNCALMAPDGVAIEEGEI